MIALTGEAAEKSVGGVVAAAVSPAVESARCNRVLPGRDEGSARSAASFLAFVADDRYMRTPITGASLLGAGAARTKH